MKILWQRIPMSTSHWYMTKGEGMGKAKGRTIESKQNIHYFKPLPTPFSTQFLWAYLFLIQEFHSSEVYWFLS